ncbi:MAG TPA: hypothetical protein VKG85_02175 [Actinomycetes bacterium]|nr:hypothetical protein [Actinomycetes bacterium]
MPTRSDWPRTKTWLPAADQPAPSRSFRRGYIPAALIFGLLLIGGLYLSVLRPGSDNPNNPDNPSSGDQGTAAPSAAATGPGGGSEPADTGSAGTTGRQLVAGVPVGYPHSQAGAEAAAANYLAAYGSESMFSPTARAEILEAIVARADQKELTGALAQSFGLAGQAYGLDSAGLPAKGLDLVARTVPVGITVKSYSPAEAVVDVWAVSIIGLAGETSTRPISEAWNTATVTLRWADGDWKWASVSQRDGPTPVSGLQPPSSAGQLAEALLRFQELRHGR